MKIKNIRSKDDDPGLRGEFQFRSARGVAVSSVANELAVTQLRVPSSLRVKGLEMM